MIELEAGRWRVDMGGGLGLELVLLFSRTLAFWRVRGRLVASAAVGEA